MKFKALSLAALAGFPAAALAQFTETFDTINVAWVTDRSEPAGFTAVVFDGSSRLQLTIGPAALAADPFYNTQGRQRDGGITGPWTLSAQVYIASAYNTTTGPIVSSELWGHTGTTPAGGAYLEFGFTNASPSDVFNPNPVANDRAFRFRALDIGTAQWVDLALPGGFAFNAWHTLSGTSTGTTFEYRLDGALIYTTATSAGNDLLSAMIQGYNFGGAAPYSVYWDNVNASAIPEPSTYAFIGGGAALGLACWRRRRVAT